MSQQPWISGHVLPLGAGATVSGLRANRVLASLPLDDLQRWQRALKPVQLRRGQVLSAQQAFFPTSATISLLSTTGTGDSAEVAVVGNEGLVGVGLAMGGDYPSSQAEVTNAGHAFVLDGVTLREEFFRSDTTMTLMLACIQALMVQTVQTALCVQHHSILQRLSRSLLDNLDRQPGSSTLELTQQLLAVRLGVRRESVTTSALQLQSKGIMTYRHGVITVHDRKALYECSCECYGVVRDAYDRLLPAPACADAESTAPQARPTLARPRPGLGFAALIADGARAQAAV